MYPLAECVHDEDGCEPDGQENERARPSERKNGYGEQDGVVDAEYVESDDLLQEIQYENGDGDGKKEGNELVGKSGVRKKFDQTPERIDRLGFFVRELLSGEKSAGFRRSRGYESVHLVVGNEERFGGANLRKGCGDGFGQERFRRIRNDENTLFREVDRAGFLKFGHVGEKTEHVLVPDDQYVGTPYRSPDFFGTLRFRKLRVADVFLKKDVVTRKEIRYSGFQPRSIASDVRERRFVHADFLFQYVFAPVSIRNVRLQDNRPWNSEIPEVLFFAHYRFDRFSAALEKVSDSS